MTAKDQVKLLNAGFTIIRKEGENTLSEKKIKFKSTLHHEWKTLDKYPTNAAMQRAAKELLENRMIVED